MAGEISIPIPLTQTLLDELKRAGLKVQVKVDCSHNAHVRTMRQDRPGQPIIAKPIELDCLIEAMPGEELGTVLGKMQGARSTSPLFRFYQELTKVKPSGGIGGVSALTVRNLKVEFPNFDVTIVNLQVPVNTIKDALAACQATTMAAFNSLSPQIRSSMGMYQRTNVSTFALVGAREPQPRTAVA